MPRSPPVGQGISRRYRPPFATTSAHGVKRHRKLTSRRHEEMPHPGRKRIRTGRDCNILRRTRSSSCVSYLRACSIRCFSRNRKRSPGESTPCRGGGDDRGWPSPPRHRRKPFPIPRRRGCSSSAYSRTHSALKRVGRRAVLHCFPGTNSPVHRQSGVSAWRIERAGRRGVPGTTTVFQFLRADFPARRTFRKTRLFPKREKSGSCRSVRNIQPSSLTGRLET